MNIKILSQNIANNPQDFNAERLEELFNEYAQQCQKQVEMDCQNI